MLSSQTLSPPSGRAGPLLDVLLCDQDAAFIEDVARCLATRGYQVAGPLSELGPVTDLSRHAKCDALVMDLHFGGVSGPDAVSLVREKAPGPATLVFTDVQDLSVIQRSLELGADGVVLKHEGVDALERALGQVTSPLFRRVRSSMRPEKVWSPGARSLDQPEPPGDLAERLTRRERQVVEELARGADTASMASALGLGEATVRTHLRNAFQKARVHSRLELVAWTVRTGIVQLEGPSGDA